MSAKTVQKAASCIPLTCWLSLHKEQPMSTTSEHQCAQTGSTPLIDFQSPGTAAMGSRAILQHIQVRRAALLDLNGHPSLILHNVLALHSYNLCMPKNRVGWSGCHLHCKLILALTTHMVVVMSCFLFLLCICIPNSHHGVITSTLQSVVHAKLFSWHGMRGMLP